MLPDEIRATGDAISAEIEKTAKDGLLETASAALGVGVGALAILIELTAQLAELNEAQKPRWVKLGGPDTVPIYIDATKVRSVRPGGEKTTVIEDDWKQTSLIFEPLATVLKKLGITAE